MTRPYAWGLLLGTNPSILPQPVATGKIADRPLAHLLAYVRERRLTGTLSVDSPSGSSARFVARAGVFRKAGVAVRGAAEEPLDGPSAVRRANKFTSDSTFAFYPDHDPWPEVAGGGDESLALIWEACAAPLVANRARGAVEQFGNFKFARGQQTTSVALAFEPRLKAIISEIETTPINVRVVARAHGSDGPRIVLFMLLTKIVSVIGQSGKITSVPVQGASEPPIERGDPERGPDTAVIVARLALRAMRTAPRDAGISQESSNLSPHDPRVSPTGTPAARASAEVATGVDARRQEILARTKAIENENYFQMLGLSPDCSAADVRKAFIALVKTWHPDRLPAVLSDVREQCSRVFSHLSEAHDTLTDAVQRERYMKLMSEGGATPLDQARIADVVEAATNFQKAEVMLRRGDIDEAEALAKLAVEAEPKEADYIALAGWIAAQRVPAGEFGGLDQVVLRLSEAIALNDRCEKAYFYRGLVQKRLGQMSRAYLDFKRAAELNPRNLDALREVRLYDMRARKSLPPRDGPRSGPPKPKLSFFGRLFKKD